jgi:hypothetical protein
MRTFRVYILDAAGHVDAPALIVEAETVGEAADTGEAQAEGRSYEIWEGDQMLVHVTATRRHPPA